VATYPNVKEYVYQRDTARIAIICATRRIRYEAVVYSTHDRTRSGTHVSLSPSSAVW